MSHLAATLIDALTGIRDLASDVVDDLQATGEAVPEPLSTRAYSGQFRVRIPPQLHRELAIEAAERGISLNRLASDRLARSC
jgi:predicted HicB family RNase H-like nuclease